MKKVITLLIFAFSAITFGQDILMQNGTFNQCTDRFFDSGGEFGTYSDNENFSLTICPTAAGDAIQLSFTEFSTQLNLDVLTIYDGPDNTFPSFGNFSGGNNPGVVEATSPSGCLTIEFVSNGSGTTTGWAADIACLTPCQSIVANIDSTNPALVGNIVVADVNETITFNGSGTFSVDGTGATYFWDFGDTNTATGQSVTHQYAAAGLYDVTLVITDTNPAGCSSTNNIDIVAQIGASGPGNPFVEAGDDVVIDCADDCTDITAEFLDIGETNTYTVSEIPFVPPFDFDGLTNSLNPNQDDRWSDVENLPFDFCFFNNIETQFQVGSNGVIRFVFQRGSHLVLRLRVPFGICRPAPCRQPSSADGQEKQAGEILRRAVGAASPTAPPPWPTKTSRGLWWLHFVLGRSSGEKMATHRAKINGNYSTTTELEALQFDTGQKQLLK